ncbi:STAS domain-containing protein [Peribacillus sp. SCS-37]|uniref:STAS domain-containing protein n=1 Tax=Paraperibacillus esterisolvens TaxID=3115296 RepID=UPI0039060BA9
MMKQALKNIGSCLEEDKDKIIEELLEKESSDIGSITENREHFRRLLASLINLVAISFREEWDGNDREGELNKGLGTLKKHGTNQTDLVDLICLFRMEFLIDIRKRCVSEALSPDDIFAVNDKVTEVFDGAIRSIIRTADESVEAIEKEMLELAAPVVPIKKGVAVLPLIGDFSESRASYITNQVIPKIAGMDISMLIIDFSGIHVFDTFVAQHFFQIHDILKLLGIDPVITGIRPALAQTAVQLGINMADIRAHSNVQQVLEVLE